MFCTKCGHILLDDSKYCDNCGAKVQSEPDSEKTETAKNTEKQSKKKPIKWLIVLLAFLLIIIAAIAITLKVMFPLKVSFSVDEQECITEAGVFDNFTVEIKANQPIKKISYALLTTDDESNIEYVEVESEGSYFEKKMVIDELAIPPGEVQLKILVDTIFDSDTHMVELEFDMGNFSAPEFDAIEEVEEGVLLVTNELLVVFKDGVSEDEINELISYYDGEVAGQLWFMNQYQIRFEGSGESYINDLKEELEAEDIVEAVYYNMALDSSVSLYPNDSKYDDWNVDAPSGNNWGLECIDAPGAWEYQDEMSTVKVGVIDSSLQYTHSDLQIDKSRTFILATDDFSTLKDLQDYYSENEESHRCISEDGCVFCEQKDHGTHVSGIVGALGNNEHGVSGVNWNAEMCFTTEWYYTISGDGQIDKVSTYTGTAYNIARLVMSGCRVINMSFGAGGSTEITEYEKSVATAYDDMIRKLEENGYDFLLVKSAGNANDDASKYQINRILTTGNHAKAHTMIVGAVSNASSIVNRLASWAGDLPKIYNMAFYSNYGDLIDITAPGTDIYNTISGNSYENMSGTSMAAPMVAGVASLVYSINPNLTYDRVKSVLCFTGEEFCAKNLQVYSIVNAKNAVEWVRNNGTKLPELETPTVGFVTGLIQDAVTLEVIENAAVLLTNNETGEVFESVVEYGTYYCYLQPGIYKMQIASVGYIPEEIFEIEIVDGVVNYNVLLNMVPEGNEQGVATGRVVDAFDASSISHASLKVYRGVNHTSGEAVLTTQSDEQGNYSLTLSPGNYTVFASREGYTSSATTITVVANATRGEQNCTLAPVLKAGEMRVVLTWGQYPADLDSHLTGPSPEGSFHIFFEEKNYQYEDVLYNNLDVDDTNSYGPETTSVYVGLDGTYTFYVHNYSNRDSSTSSAMATSEAQVKLYMAGMDAPMIFNVPNQPGTLWKVFTVNDGQVIPVNTMGFQANPQSIN